MAAPTDWIYRHSLLVRLTHGLNVPLLAILLMSGLQIFNAHPALYWGDHSSFEHPLFSISNTFTAEGRPAGVTEILGRRLETTGVLGWSRLNGRPAPRAFPGWLTVPSGQDLATGRRWHFLLAWLFVVNGVAYLGYSFASSHLVRDLVPRRDEWSRIGPTLLDTLTLRLHRGNQSRYNVLQRLSYLTVVLLLSPLVVLTGLSMSPAIGATTPWLVDAFGGRQSARTLHFIVTLLLTAFVVVHVTMVLLSGFLRNVRSMVTGWYSASPKRARP